MRSCLVPAVLATCVLLSACGPSPQPESEAGSAPVPATAPIPAPQGPLNVVWILLDACRADHLSSYGYSRPTSPNIDALAARGVLFERNYAQAPNTLLSVPSYMTGRHNPVFYQDARHLGIWFLREAPPEEQLISRILKDNGYQTAMFSASPWYSADSRLGKSFDDFYGLVYGPDAPEGGLRAKNPGVFIWMESHAKAPFFLYLHLLDTHEPRYRNNTATTWLDPEFPRKRDGELRRWKNGTFSPEDQQHIVDLYDGGVAYADRGVGEIGAALERLGIAEKTLVVVSSDHGEILGQDGKTLGHPMDSSTDDVLHTPLIIAGPGLPRGRRVSARTENADIVPTLFDLLNLKGDVTFDGVSLRALVESDTAPAPHEFVFARTQSFLIDDKLNRVLIFDDTKFDVSGFDPQSIEMLKLPKRPPVIAYALPDSAGKRRAITPDPALAARAAQIDSEQLKPAWEVYAALPRVTPPYFETSSGGSLDPAAVVEAFDSKDNLWTRQRSGYLFRISESDLLIADPATEDPPALILGVSVPNGEYRVQAFTCSPSDEGTPRGISFKFSKFPFPEGSSYQEFGLPAPEPGKIAEGWFDVGTYSVTEGNFVYSIDTGPPEDLTVFGALRFTKVGEDVVPLDEQALKEEKDKLETLGYGKSK